MPIKYSIKKSKILNLSVDLALWRFINASALFDVHENIEKGFNKYIIMLVN